MSGAETLPPAALTGAAPALRELLLAQAAAHARAGAPAEGEACVMAALDLGGRDAEALCLLGKIQAQRDDLAAARASLQAALALDPQHAGARAVLACLESGGTTRYRRLLAGKAGALGMTAVLAVGALAIWATQPAVPLAPAQSQGRSQGQSQPQGGAEAGAQARPGAPPTASSAARAPRGGNDAALPLADIDRFAAYAAGLRRFDPVAAVRAEAASGPRGLAVRLSGKVPSEHVQQVLRAHAAEHAGLLVDDAAVVIERRYTVRRGDTLSSIAGRLYGRTDRWPELQRANRNLVGPGDRIEAGAELEVP